MKRAGVCAFLVVLASVLPAQASFQDLLASGTARQVLEAVQAGADVRQSSRAGVTPLMIAAAGNPDPAVITVILAAGAPVDERDWVGATALIYAARFNTRPDVVKALAGSGAEVDVRDGLGETALMYAAQFNPSPEVVRALLDAGARVDGRDASGLTALMLAAQSNPKPSVVRALLDRGADVNRHNVTGMTALERGSNLGPPGCRGGRARCCRRRRDRAFPGLEELAPARLRRARAAAARVPVAGLFSQLPSAIPSPRRYPCPPIVKNAPILMSC